jgi:hypothetical protein
MDRNKAFATAATAAVVSALVLGFWNIGSPGNQREISADQRRSEDLQRIANALNYHYSLKNHTLPSSLSEVQPVGPYLRIQDPLTLARYDYQALAGSKFQICANFSTDTAKDENLPARNLAPLFARHPRGRQCFTLDATQAAPAGFP